MSDRHPFQGNWVARMYERVRERGYDSLTAFAEARPTLPLHLLGKELGKGMSEFVSAVSVRSLPSLMQPYPPPG
jgi:hypothetical protein